MKRGIPQEEAYRILADADCGVLSLVTPEGEPYGVMIHPVYVPEENCVFFHCAKTGKKIDCIHAHPTVSLFVSAEHTIVPEKYTTRYASAIVTGHASFVEEDAEKHAKLELLCERFSPGLTDHDAVIKSYWNAVVICRINITEITGKRNRF